MHRRIWPARAAEWCDAAFLVPQLVLCGHTPPEAEEVAALVPAFAAAEDEAITAFAVAAAGVTERQRRKATSPAGTALAAARLAWARHRLESQ
jgi:hypothetical protein